MEYTLNIFQYLSKNGRPYKPGLVPPWIPRGEVGDCFDTCMMAVVNDASLRYVEGVARKPGTKEWVLHAWVTDASGLAFDLTWKAFDRKTNEEIPVPTDYIGIEIDINLLVDFVRATEYKSVLSNYWRNRELSDKILK